MWVLYKWKWKRKGTGKVPILPHRSLPGQQRVGLITSLTWKTVVPTLSPMSVSRIYFVLIIFLFVNSSIDSFIRSFTNSFIQPFVWSWISLPRSRKYANPNKDAVIHIVLCLLGTYNITSDSLDRVVHDTTTKTSEDVWSLSLYK